jgi:hypothetical protein
LFVTARDAAGNTARADFRVTLDTIPPEIVITSALPTITSESEIVVSYQVDRGTEETKSFSLIEGANRLSIDAQDLAGNIGRIDFTVTYDPNYVDQGSGSGTGTGGGEGSSGALPIRGGPKDQTSYLYDNALEPVRSRTFKSADSTSTGLSSLWWFQKGKKKRAQANTTKTPQETSLSLSDIIIEPLPQNLLTTQTAEVSGEGALTQPLAVQYALSSTAASLPRDGTPLGRQIILPEIYFTAEDAPGLPGVSGAVPVRDSRPRAGGGDAERSRPLTKSAQEAAANNGTNSTGLYAKRKKTLTFTQMIEMIRDKYAPTNVKPNEMIDTGSTVPLANLEGPSE